MTVGNGAEVLLFYIIGFGWEPCCGERAKPACSWNAHSIYFYIFLMKCCSRILTA